MSNQKDFGWITALLKGLPASLLFILAVDSVLLKNLISLYNTQSSNEDPLKVYILIAILSIVFVNLVIIGFFANLSLKENTKISSVSKNDPAA